MTRLVRNKPVQSFHAIVPSAGVGKRLGLSTPKQYLPIGPKTILQWTVDVLCSAAWIQSIVVVVAPDDRTASQWFGDRPQVRVHPVGGQTRRDSVRNGLACLHAAADDDWILVQDAARPGLSLALLERLRLEIESDEVGGLLAIPMADTVKRQTGGGSDRSAQRRSVARSSPSIPRIANTVDRDGLWLAQTPQVFRRALLRRALDQTPGATDEASAVEALGLSPRLVMGARENFKVTTVEDFELMQRLLLSTSPVKGRQ